MHLDSRRLGFLIAAILASGFASAGGCVAQSDKIDPGTFSGDGDGDGDDEDGDDEDGDDDDKDPQDHDEEACLLHNCNSDDECGGCSEGRTSCLVSENRCVACNAGESGGCPEGEECSSYGNCIPEGLTCATDAHGTPMISCSDSADCAACDPLHQVCNASGQCVACTDSDTSQCQSTDQCIADQCAARCPSACDTDNDCASCGVVGAEAHACNAHKCAECSATYACPAGLQCSPQGVCETVCGNDGEGTCYSDADCSGCGAENTTCHQPINGGAGTCGPSAAGCSDLGGVALPAPFNQVTNLCSGDQDCAGVGIEYNVGELLRDLTGIDDIGDANIDYGMNVCADIEIGGDISCGMCVPCREDSDCQGIDIDQVALEAFGPLGSVAAAILLDQVFGPNDHVIHMYCEAVAGDYGVCAPCPGLIYECGVGGGGSGSSSSSSSGGGGSCDHEVCDVGGPLDGSCDSCSAIICDIDDYCCTQGWDSQCVGLADQYCDGICGGGSGQGGGGAGGGDPSGSSSSSGGGETCHDECTEGGPMDYTCSGCVEAICNYDDYCCVSDWDDVCVGYVDEFCDPPC